MVGTSGSASERVLVVTARARNLPARICSIVVGTGLNTCPFRKSYPDILMMQPSQNGYSDNAADALDNSPQWRILL
jgi:hypothetical protein